MTIQQIKEKIDAVFGMTGELVARKVDPRWIRPDDENWDINYKSPTGLLICVVGVVRHAKSDYYFSGGSWPYETAKAIGVTVFGNRTTVYPR